MTRVPSHPLNLTTRRDLIRAAAGGALLATLPGFGASAESPGTGVDSSSVADEIKPFRVFVAQPAIDDLKRRISATRLPDQQTKPDWTQGVPLEKAKTLLSYWSSGYDWRMFEERINSFPQYRTTIDGLGIHFIHVRSKHVDALPIILTHGWPGSIVEFLKVIGPLTDPTRHDGTEADAFHVVIPSMPGFGFSDKPNETGWDVVRTAKAWGSLMQRLGYNRQRRQENKVRNEGDGI